MIPTKGSLRDLFASATPDPDPYYVDPNKPNIPVMPGLGGPNPILGRIPSSGYAASMGATSPMFSGIPLSGRLAKRLDNAMIANDRKEYDMIIDTLQQVTDVFDQVMRVPRGDREPLLRGLYTILDRVAAIHPHDGCPYCKIERKVDDTVNGGEVDETTLFHWLMNNWSESKQNIVARLKRDYKITKKGT